MTSVALIFGGRSPEHEVSIVSARNVFLQLKEAGFTPIPVGIDRSGLWHVGEQAFDRLINPEPATHEARPPHPFARLNALQADVVFPMVHGHGGEDGALAAFCELAGIPYVGGGVLNASLCWDKLSTRTLLLANHIPQLPFVAFYKSSFQSEEAVTQVEARFPYPVFVKPSRAGSSIGISRATDRAALEAALKTAFEFDYRVIVEPGLDNALEVEIAGLGGLVPQLSPPARIITENDFYDFEEKYLKNSTQFEIPANLSPHQLKKMHDLAKRAWQLLNCYGMGRIDFLITPEEVYLNEINTCPGFTSISMYPRLMAEMGVEGPELMKRLVALALNRETEASRTTDFSSSRDWWKS